MQQYGFGLGALQLDDARAGMEESLAALGRGRMYAARIIGTAGAANNAIAELKNPTGSGKTAYLFLGDLFVQPAMAVNFVFDGTSIAPVGVPTPMLVGGGASVCTVGGSNQLGPTGTVFIATPSLTANIAYLLPSRYWAALPPNHTLQLQGGTVNQAFTVNLRWIELTN